MIATPDGFPGLETNIVCLEHDGKNWFIGYRALGMSLLTFLGPKSGLCGQS